MSLLSKAQACMEMSEELLLAGDNAGSLECVLEAAKYLQLIRLLRQAAVQDCADQGAVTAEQLSGIYLPSGGGFQRDELDFTGAEPGEGFFG